MSCRKKAPITRDKKEREREGEREGKRERS